MRLLFITLMIAAALFLTATLSVLAPRVDHDREHEGRRLGQPPAEINSPVSRDEEAAEAEGEEFEMGPPPFGYWRITSEPVPNWVPAPPRPTDTPGPWSSLGPHPIINEYWSGNANASGRVVSIAIDPTSPSTVYIASASGGIWKTADAGLNWAPLTDELSILTHGYVALDPSNHNTVYAGTGEYVTGSGGDGLFRSLDAGATWTRIATASQVGSTISKVVIDPTDPTRIYTSGNLGFIRSTTGGSAWSTCLSGACSDLVLNPQTPQTLFIARDGDGVYRSIDGGNTVAKLTNGLPSTGMASIALAIGASNPSVVYAAFANTSSGLLGLYRTSDGGNTWSLLANTPNFPSPQAWYDMCLAVDPTNENTVYAGGVFPSYAVAGVIRSTNGGASWTDITVGPGGGQVHPDMHAIVVGPDGTLWVGSDGGIWKSTSIGTSWTNCNATLNITQNYQIALHPTDPAMVIGGTQDNGTINRTGSDPWPQILSGDGGFACYDFTNPSRRYITYVNLDVFRQFGGTTDISGPWSGDPRQFIAPLVMDPGNAHTLIGGTNRVWRTTNADGASVTWTPISDSSVCGGSTLTAIAIAPGASNTIYVGGDSGRIAVTTDAATWPDRSGGLSGSTVSDLIINPAAPGSVYVSFAGTGGIRVARTDNYGQNWADRTGTLPSGVAAKSLAVDWRFNPPTLYLGSGAGIYSSADDGMSWTKDGADFPNVIVDDLRIDTVANTITAGTYGRGTFRATLPVPPPACYANCDNSTAPPILNVADFTCFLQRFAAGDPYANCDNSTQQPVLNVADFTCFLQKYAAGCP
jgi:photosystem II stability/assembly factor-like uncharacterized protein